MTTIQELTTNLSQTEDMHERETLSKQLTEAIRKQDILWAAFCPATKHYFLAQEENQITAYLFSSEELCLDFKEQMKKRHIMLEALKNEEQHRMFLFAELFRCGVTQIVLDSAENYFAVPLFALMPVPDYSNLPLVQRPVLNPAVTGKLLLLMQDMRWGRADGNTELDALQEIYHSPFLHPFKAGENGEPDEAGVYQMPDGGSLFMIFTDLYSLKTANPAEYARAKIVRFADLHQLLTEHPEKTGIIINPGSGAPMLLDMQLLELTQKAAEGDLSEVTVRSMNENSGRVIVTKPEMPNHDMINHITDYVKDKKIIHRIWLRTIRKEEEIRPHYLIIIDWMDGIEKEQRKQIRKEISEVAMPFARGLHIEYVSYHYEHGKAWTGSSEPFYIAETPETAQTADNAEIPETPENTETKTPAPQNAEPKKETPKKKGFFSGLFGKKS